MKEIGRITRVQVQPSSLKIEHFDESYYDPSPLRVVERLHLTPDGIIGITTESAQIIDVHHVKHPTSHNRRKKNGVSLGFTSHYEAMRIKFGPHLIDGRAGENMLIESSAIQKLEDLGQQLAIQSKETGELVYLSTLKVAAPCVEFSHFAAHATLPLEAKQLKETLQFLHKGIRGFYATATGEGIVKVGDRVFRID
ncbi:MAG: hypothetical protein M3Z24_16565 [Chloroflexota bacterium]|nr:hypothetical protein [Chloroflexota bacterium]